MTFEEIHALQKQMQQNITTISRFLFYVKRQQFFFSNKQMTVCLDNLSKLLPLLSKHMEDINGEIPILTMENLLAVIQEMQLAQKEKDYVMLMDMVELQILPTFISIEERLVSAMGVVIDEEIARENISCCKEKNPQLLYSLLPVELIAEITEEHGFSDSTMEELVKIVDQCVAKGIAVEPTSCGCPTMAVQKGDHVFYIHTNGNVVSQSLELAWEWTSQEKDAYTFYGFGMGYPYLEMLLMDHNISIRVYETSRDFLLLAMLFSPLGKLLRTGRFELIYDPTGNKMKHDSLCINEEEGFYVFYPALHGVQREDLREKLESYFVDESSIRTHFRRLNRNFRKNRSADAKGINELRENYSGREVIIVAAGPSLDKNIEELKERKEGTILLAVGTVLKKLLRVGIRPDYVIMIDGYTSVYSQIIGVEDCGVPLIFLSTVYSKILNEYQADKYCLCQKGFEPAERLAEERGWELVESGGSVTTAALDLCLRLQAKKIILVGADLAYTGARNHASDTIAGADQISETGIFVDAINGGKVQTSRNLKLYLEWIEKRLRNRSEKERKIQIIDATEGGARKKGMQNMSLRDAMSGNPG